MKMDPQSHKMGGYRRDSFVSRLERLKGSCEIREVPKVLKFLEKSDEILTSGKGPCSMEFFIYLNISVER